MGCGLTVGSRDFAYGLDAGRGVRETLKTPGCFATRF